MLSISLDTVYNLNQRGTEGGIAEGRDCANENLQGININVILVYILMNILLSI